jgi:DNA-binding transcriptional ArsR family regulator
MSRPSSVSRLPDEIRLKIGVLRDQGRTIDEILSHLEKLDVEVSRSALGRHLKKIDAVAEDMRRNRAIAEGIGRTLGDEPTSRVARMNIELLHGMLMKIMTGADEEGGPVTLDAKESMMLAIALEKAAKASKSDLETQIKAAVESERRDATKEAAKAAETSARKAGLSAQTVEAIKASILGVSQ